MTSPVDTSVKYFSSLMSGAPVLSGTAGSGIALLDACVKDGFDLKTLTSLVALAGVMTATFSGVHSSQVDSVVLIAGVTGGPAGFAGANGEQKVTARPTATTATWATTLPDGTYTGTVTMKMAPLGFAKIFSGTNLAGYQSTDPASTKMILRLDDTVATTMRVVGCEVMSDINTYSGLFPTAAQMSGGGYWAKSVNASAAAVQWMLVGDSRGFFLHVCAGYSTNALYAHGVTRYFGDLVPMRPGGDAYAACLSYSTTSTAVTQTDGQPEYQNGQTLQAMPRSATGLGSAQLNACFPYTGTSNLASGSDTFFGAFPSIVDGKLRLSKRFVAPSTGVPPRADLPGLYSVPHNLAVDSFKFNDRVGGADLLAGRNLVAVNTATGAMNNPAVNSNAGAAFLDITGPWSR